MLTNEQMNQLQENVNRGASLLDGKRSGWWREIDPAKLNLADCKRCILGQLFGDAI